MVIFLRKVSHLSDFIYLHLSVILMYFNLLQLNVIIANNLVSMSLLIVICNFDYFSSTQLASTSLCYLRVVYARHVSDEIV